MSAETQGPKNMDEAIDLQISIHKKLGFTSQECQEIANGVEYYFKFLITEKLLEKSQSVLKKREEEQKSSGLILPDDPMVREPE